MLIEFLKYVDLFGTKFSFYIDKRRKFYTYLSGIFSILSIFLYIVVFLFVSKDDFNRVTPVTSTSEIHSLGYHKVKFSQEKIWIPWRIKDYNLKFVDHTGILYPVIYYFYGEKEPNSREGIHLKHSTLNYSLCNETSMVNKTDLYNIEIPLDELYCIDTEDLYLGGSLISNFVYFIEFDLFLCKDGIPYDENNENCTSISKLKKYAGENNSFIAEFYYPIVQFQPANIKNPIIAIYKHHFYHLSKFSNKIDRIYLQEYVLQDDLGWITSKNKNYTIWGFSSITGDSYFSALSEDIMNEGSSSRVYSFNIYLEPGIIFHKRSYKKLFEILGEVFPICNLVVSFFKIVARLFKLSDGTKKLTGLLFENIQEKKQKIKLKKTINQNKNYRRKLDFNQQPEDMKQKRKSRKFHSLKRETVIIFKKENTIFDNSQIPMTNAKGDFESKQIERLSIGNIIRPKHNAQHLLTKGRNSFTISNDAPSNNKKKIKENIIEESGNKSNINKSLFPYAYYFCSIFIKNINISKNNNKCFSSKYINIYNFLCQLFDVSTYFLLLSEFDVLKNLLLDKKKLKLIEVKRKININDNAFMDNIQECINNNQLNIFSKSFFIKSNK